MTKKFRDKSILVYPGIVLLLIVIIALSFAMNRQFFDWNKSDAGESLTSINEEWNLYTNIEQGYSLKVPKNAAVWDCKYENFGEIVSVKVIKEANISFITHEYFYDQDNNCEKTFVNEIPKERGVAWKIVSKDVQNMAELGGFVKEIYGEECEVEEVAEDGNVYLIQDFVDCPINYITSIRYNSEANKAYSLDIGHAENFMTENFDGYDYAMVMSFNFL
jgi:hypothetical protein